MARQDHFPLPFKYQILERVVGRKFYSLLKGYSRYKEIKIAPEDKEKSLSHVLLVLLLIKDFLLDYIMH